MEGNDKTISGKAATAVYSSNGTDFIKRQNVFSSHFTSQVLPKNPNLTQNVQGTVSRYYYSDSLKRQNINLRDHSLIADQHREPSHRDCFVKNVAHTKQQAAEMRTPIRKKKNNMPLFLNSFPSLIGE